jgi:hypothetical protein
LSASSEWQLSATVRPRELPDRRWAFPFSEVVLVEGERRTLEGQLVLGGRTIAGVILRPAEWIGGGALSILGGLASQVPVGEPARQFASGVAHAGQELSQEILGTDGPAAAVRDSGGAAEVRLSDPNHDQEASGSVDLHGPGRLTVRGLPRAATVLLDLKRLR